MRELMIIVPVVGLLLTIVAAKRLGRRRAWLCGLACAIVAVAHTLILLEAVGVIGQGPTAENLLDKAFLFGLRILPLMDLVGFALLIAASLGRERSIADPPELEHDASSRPSLVRRSVTIPVWVGAVAVVIAIGGGVAALSAIPTDDAVPRLVQGSARLVDAEGSSTFVFDEASGKDPSRRLALNSRFWIDRSGAQRNDGTPACLQVDATHKVELAFIDVTGSRRFGAGDFPYLLSVRCID